MNILKPMMEVIALCAGAAAGIFILNFVSDAKEKKEKEEVHHSCEGSCGCHHDADGDCCGGGCGHCGEGHECCGHCHKEDDAE